MSKKTKKAEPKTNIAFFYLDPKTSKKDRESVFRISQILCNTTEGFCLFPLEGYPARMSLAILDDDTRPPGRKGCMDGWIMAYEFPNLKEAKQFASDVSLLKPICNITLRSGRFETCFKNEWLACNQ